jgi:hypothetical protein
VAARVGPAAAHEPEIVAIVDRDLVATADVVRGRHDDGRAATSRKYATGSQEW